MNAATSRYNVPDLRASERALLHLLRLKGALSKAELARLSDMSAQGVSIIVERLLDLGLVRKGSKKRGRVGQPSTPIELNPDGAASLGIFVGNDEAQFAVVNFAGETVMERRVEYDDPRSDVTSQKLADVAGVMVGNVDEKLWGRGVGVGVSARESLLRGLSQASRNRLDGLAATAGEGDRLASRLKERFDLPVHCVNDIRAACLAQIASDGARGAVTTLYLNIGETLGSGLILEGQLIGAEDELSTSLHSLPIAGFKGAKVQDFASFEALRREMKDTPFQFQDQIACDFRDTRAIYEDWRKEAVSALAMAIRAACATVPVHRVLVASRLGSDDRASFVKELRFVLETEVFSGNQTPEISDCMMGSNARAWGTALVPFFKAFGASAKSTAADGTTTRRAVA